jgi:hypothetical protein
MLNEDDGQLFVHKLHYERLSTIKAITTEGDEERQREGEKLGCLY